MGCLKLTYQNNTELKIISSKKELTYNKSNNKGFSSYLFGFNGKEKDNETYGDGNAYDYGFRIYNSQLGKFFSVDPLYRSYPFYTPYQFASNTPILSIDIDGLEANIQVNKVEEKITINNKSIINTKAHNSCHHLQPVMYPLLKPNPTTKLDRLIIDGTIIVGGAILIAYSGGTATPVVEAAYVFSGTMAIAGGTAKGVADATGNYEASDKIPTSYFQALAYPIEVMAGDETHIISGTLNLVEGVLTWKPSDVSKFKTIIGSVEYTVNAASVGVSASDLRKKITGQVTEKIKQNNKNKQEAKKKKSKVKKNSNALKKSINKGLKNPKLDKKELKNLKNFLKTAKTKPLKSEN